MRTPRLNEKEFLADVLRPFHDAIVKALAPHFHDVFEGEDPADDPDLIHYAIDLIHDAGRPFGTFIDDDLIATAIHDFTATARKPPCGTWNGRSNGTRSSRHIAVLLLSGDRQSSSPTSNNGCALSFLKTASMASGSRLASSSSPASTRSS